MVVVHKGVSRGAAIDCGRVSQVAGIVMRLAAAADGRHHVGVIVGVADAEAAALDRFAGSKRYRSATIVAF